MRPTTCLVITRDRVSFTRLCVASLERYGLDIHIVDHGSTWSPMCEYLSKVPWPVHLREDHTPRDLWSWELLTEVTRGRPYLVTDCDIILDPDCPDDWLDRLFTELGRTLSLPLVKVGLGLRIDDLPDTRLGHAARQWETSFWSSPTGEGAYRAPVDTTLALYPPLYQNATFALGPARRLGHPYLVKHLPWYGDLDPEEALYYKAHCLPGASHWVNGGWSEARVTS